MARYLEAIRMPAPRRRGNHSAGFLARAILLKRHPPELAQTQLAFALARLADDAHRHYREARTGLRDFAKHRDVGGYFRGVSALEMCIVSLYRASEMVRAFRRFGFLDSGGVPVVARPARASVGSDSGNAHLRRLRDAVQHFEDRIVRRQVPPAQAIGPRPHATTFRVDCESVRYRRLRDWIGELDDIVRRIAMVEQTTRLGRPS